MLIWSAYNFTQIGEMVTSCEKNNNIVKYEQVQLFMSKMAWPVCFVGHLSFVMWNVSRTFFFLISNCEIVFQHWTLRFHLTRWLLHFDITSVTVAAVCFSVSRCLWENLENLFVIKKKKEVWTIKLRMLLHFSQIRSYVYFHFERQNQTILCSTGGYVCRP